MNTPQTNDSGPAFPCEEQIRCNGEVVDTRKFTGMTLRDWFAGMALQGNATRLNRPHHYRDVLASDCYEIADAMIAAREAAK